MNGAGLDLEIADDDGAIAVLRSRVDLEADGAARTFGYRTRTGALLRIGGIVRGAFDSRHERIEVRAPAGGALTLEVEHRSLPVSGLPPGDGVRWRRMLARAQAGPARAIAISRANERGPLPAKPRDPLAIAGHSHLDVAWLWTYEEAARKALRTFATAVRQLENDPEFVFTQSQPQLYAFVAERDRELFERVRAFARAGRFDTSGAALWVEPDCNVPSGESLLRQLQLGIRYIEREFGTAPSVAWLPDTFGFANTLPMLLVHAGIHAFGTTKLGWNDTTAFPYPRFRWISPDGSAVAAANIASIEGGFARRRMRRARLRGDLLLIGHGDGGGGASDAALAEAPRYGRWTSLGAWFDSVAKSAALPEVRDELYLQEHRGTLTTHHDVKARNAALERALSAAETALAWARALHASPFFLSEARAQLDRAAEIVARAQFHDVLPGTAIAPVYLDVHREYDAAETLIAGVHANAASVLPTARFEPAVVPVAPLAARRSRFARETFVLENDALVARIARDGTLVELRTRNGPNVIRRAHRLALYGDRPKRWDAWNVDRTYLRRERRVRVTACDPLDDAVDVRYAFGSSLAVARFSLDAAEPFLRVDMAVDWSERHHLLRIEAEAAFAAARARFGSPHGTIDRPPHPRTREERAKYEAPGQRYARLDGPAGGFAIFALDTYGWSLKPGARGTKLGHSLLRGPTWPDPNADRGSNAFSFAYAPFGALGIGTLEAWWERFARANEVPMFTSPDPALLVVATALASDGKRIVVRVRECDGAQREAELRCGARARSACSIDALERPVARDVELVEGALVTRFEPYELRTFAVELA
jgi:alpha-mannosidase